MRQVAFTEATTDLTLGRLLKLVVRESAGTAAAASFDIVDQDPAGTEALVLPMELAANESVALNFANDSTNAIKAANGATLFINGATGEFDGVAYGH